MFNLSVSIIISCIIKEFCIKEGIKVTNDKIINITPSRIWLPHLQYEHAIDTLVLLRNMVKNRKIVGSFNGTNKDIHHMVKGINFWSHNTQEVFTFLLDNNAALGDNVSGEKAINLYFMKLDSEDEKNCYQTEEHMVEIV